MDKYIVEVISTVEVEIDKSKFTPEFLAAFKQSFCDLDGIEEHIEHIAQLAARERIDDGFVEGYGELKVMGIKARVDDVSIQSLEWDGGE